MRILPCFLFFPIFSYFLPIFFCFFYRCAFMKPHEKQGRNKTFQKNRLGKGMTLFDQNIDHCFFNSCCASLSFLCSMVTIKNEKSVILKDFLKEAKALHVITYAYFSQETIHNMILVAVYSIINLICFIHIDSIFQSFWSSWISFPWNLEGCIIFEYMS